MGCARFVCRGWEGSLPSFSPWMGILRLIHLSSGSILAVFSMSCTGVVFMAPSMTRRAMFWTLSSLLLLVLAAVPHVCMHTPWLVVLLLCKLCMVRIDESAP